MFQDSDLNQQPRAQNNVYPIIKKKIYARATGLVDSAFFTSRRSFAYLNSGKSACNNADPEIFPYWMSVKNSRGGKFSGLCGTEKRELLFPGSLNLGYLSASTGDPA